MKRLNRRLFIGFLLTAALSASAAEEVYLGALEIPRTIVVNPLKLETSPAMAAWANDNAASEAPVAGASATEATSVSGYRLTRARVGVGVTQVRPDYALGDRLVVPDDLTGEIDWYRTYQASLLLNPTNTLVFVGSGDFGDAAIYFACGGDPVTVAWMVKGNPAPVAVRRYVVSDTALTRPFRLYRTDAPYDSDPVSLKGQYVKVFGSEALFKLRYGTTQTVGADGHTTTNEDSVVYGVYLTGDNELYAVGDVQGQFLLVYYDSADFTRALKVQVVEACTPSVKVVSACVGDELKPTADGYETIGLYPEVVTSKITTHDGRGDFIYVHSGTDSFSPHRNAAYALRPTLSENGAEDQTWNAAINWYAPDDMGVSWPFEQVQYSVRWGEGVRLVVSGDAANLGQSPIFPDDWTVTACGYQSPDGHLVDLTWTGAGRSLLKVEGTTAKGFSDVAFISVDAVLATDIDAPVYTKAVGVAVTPEDPSAACVTNDAGHVWLGYIHKPLSVTCYDPDDYREPSSDVVAGSSSSSVEIPEDGNASAFDAIGQAIRSDIFFVNVPEGAPQATLDVWWNVAQAAGNLAGTAYFPSVRERFRPVFPSADTTEQIVLASAKGSSGVSVWKTNDGTVWHTNAIIKSVSTPHVYSGGAGATDGTGVGWNPNVAHAFCDAGDGDYVCWALRSDMVTHSTLEHPLVYVKGEVAVEGADGSVWTQRKVWTYYVLDTNEAYPVFGEDMVVGEQLPGPRPLNLFEDMWLPEIWWRDPLGGDKSRIVAYRDRKGAVWARRDGTLEIHMYYANRDEYKYTYRQPNGVPREWTVAVPSGQPVPWHCRLADNDPDMKTEAGAWTWNAQWPATAASMQIGRTLTKASDGLAEVWNAASAAVVWPEPVGMGFGADRAENDVAQLVDPTQNRTASLDGICKREDLMANLGFSTDPGGNCVYRDGVWYFANVPATLSRRVWYDPNAHISRCLVLQGRLDEKTGGISVLYMNVLNDQERQALKDLVAADNAYKGSWDSAVDSLAREPVLPSAHRYVTSVSQSGRQFTEFKTAYSPVDHYALASLGGGGVALGTNWVVWVENDAAPDSGLNVAEGDAVSMHVFRIVPDFYRATCVTRSDENNLLSQMLDVLYTEPFAGCPEDYYFQWQKAEPGADGSAPTEDDWRDAGHSGNGVTRFTLGTEGTLADLVNTYYRVRYRANPGTTAAVTMPGVWSAWTAPCLAEGWIQRVLNAITPFTQRVTDLYDNPPETTISMIRQIGGPYQGDVALNMDNLTQVGLLETYMTLLNKAETMSIAMGDDASIDKTGVNQQLMQLVERLDDFYALLGNEAYSDAANPTIACSDSASASTFNLNLSSTFCFDNQVPTLLDEELSLLRGRGVIEDETAGEGVTAYQTAPCYNRLLWNFTRGITDGEVAYALNYNITPGEDEIDIQAETAAAAYPQGHGDAWGHYLSGLKLWYRLLRNPSFSWSVSMGEMNLDDHPINVDYFEEEKMAEAAAALGKAAERIVDLTARKVWRDRAVSVTAADAGYEDKVPTRAFGYGEWGNKGGVATFVNWMVVNSLLPAADTNETAYTDTGLLKINRSTVGELTDLANRYALIQRRVDRLNDNLNPMGLADEAVPFGISTAAADGSESHFEQTLDLAKTALRNANALLEKAGESTARLRAIEDAGQAAADAAAEEEDAYDRQLIAYYGYPYDGDIGVGKTYPQGYDGPDLYHWSYVDNSPTKSEDSCTISFDTSRNDDDGSPITLTYEYSRLGIVVKPSSVTGTRRACGSLQSVYQEFTAAVNTFDAAYAVYTTIQKMADEAQSRADEYFDWKWSLLGLGIGSTVAEQVLDNMETMLALRSFKDTAEASYWLNKYVSNVNLKSDGRLTGKNGGRIKLDTKNGKEALNGAEWSESYVALKAELNTSYKWCKRVHLAKTVVGMAYGGLAIAAEVEGEDAKYKKEVDDYYQKLNEQALAVLEAFNAIGPAGEKVLTLKAEAEAVQDARAAARQKRARAAAKSRYSDMAHRLRRDEALDVYANAFDLAQKYTWLAAKAYDYETGGEITAGTGTSDFLDAIVGTRLPGELQADGSPMRWGGTGDAGLSDVLARLEENWAVQKGALGINNPQGEITWFSLRTEAFRILPGADGLNNWRNKLDTFRVSNLRDSAAYARLCLDLRSDELDEPALVIPLSTTIEFAKNFFGHDLAGGDHQFSPSYFATKIAEAGVELVGYNVGRDGGAVTSFAETPYVYLVPAGFDRMRAPATGEVLSFNVADQLLEVPNLLGSKALAKSWDALYASLMGRGTAATVRKYPPFRANGESNATTLIGRSVWNTQWVLVIPAGSIRSDRAKALEELVWGNEDTAGVTDIKIGFRTYSHWGK